MTKPCLPRLIVRAYGAYDSDQVSQDTGLECLDPSRAIQSQRDEADINVIVRNFGLTGKAPVGLVAPPSNGFQHWTGRKQGIGVKGASRPASGYAEDSRTSCAHCDPETAGRWTVCLRHGVA